MPNTTKYLLAEQVQMRLEGGYVDIAAAVQREDIYKAIEQKINSIFKMEQFSQNLPSGETIPNNLAIATYEDVVVSSSTSGKSKSTLPVMPISLPRNAGINEVRPVLNIVESGDRILGNPIIPLMAGQEYLLQADSLLNDLQGQFAYTPYGRELSYNKDLTTLGITKVDIKLVVFDISQYSVTDYLPISSDYEQQIVSELVNEFAGVTPETGVVNKNTTIQNKG